MDMPKTLDEEMRLRGFSPRTRDAYLRWNAAFLEWCRKAPREVRQQDLDAYLVHLEARKLAPRTRHAATAALRFYYAEVLRRKFRWRYPKLGRRIPIALSPDEVRRLLDAVTNPKHRLLLELLYGSGVRVSEALHLRHQDILAENHRAIIRSGKGNRDRVVILSARFLADYRSLWPRPPAEPCLFAGRNEGPLRIRSAQALLQQAARRAGLTARVHPHMLRASCATHLLDQDAPLTSIQALLGHARLETTRGYLALTCRHLEGLVSPLDRLPSREATCLPGIGPENPS